MTIKELAETLENRKQGLAYEIWKQAYLTVLGVSDLMRDKHKKANFPESPEKASPELFPRKPTIKKPNFLRKEQ